jgi:cytidine deaminase
MMDDTFDTAVVQRAFKAAAEARKHAYTPYSKFRVGAALVHAETERIFSGCNVENASYGATICAERGALTAAIAAAGVSPGSAHGPFSLLVVVADTKEPTPPCALCLQVLSEFCGPGFPIFLADTLKVQKKVLLGELLPFPFGRAQLNQQR